MLLVLALHAVLALAAGLLGRRLGRAVLLLGAVGPAAALGFTVARTGGDPVTETLAWAEAIGLTVTLRLDGFGVLFWWLIAGIGVLVMAYATRYFGQRRDLGLFTSMLVLFTGAMLLLTSADNVLVLYVAWEITSATSYFLIGFKDDEAVSRASALQALLVTATGGLALLGGLVLIGQAAGTYSLSEMLAAAPSGTAVDVGLVLVLLGAFTKSAQVPFHFWLPGAMAAPTPVSAFLHSATMVKAGVYLVARFSPAFAPSVGWWVPVVVGFGAATMIVGGYRAMRATDLKSLLAYGTVSQLGFMVLLFGPGEADWVHAGVALVLAHALFKAALFMSVGVIDHQAHTRDLRRLSGLRTRLPVTAWVTGIAAASMAGVIPLFGFIAKEEALGTAVDSALASGVVAAVIVAGSIFTAAYALRLWWGSFAVKQPADLIDGAVLAEDVPRARLSFDAPAVVLVALTVVFGLWVAPADHLVAAAAGALHADAAAKHLALWHGFELPLLLSAVALGGGYLLYRTRGVMAWSSRYTERVVDTTQIYRRSLHGLNRLADQVVTVVQPGSLPIYGSIVLTTAVVLPGLALLATGERPRILGVAESPLQIAVGAVIVLAAFGAARVRRRLSAVLMLGAVGYGVAILFVIQGAPDLALTQLLIETMSLGLFVLVLRRLPVEFRPMRWRLGQVARIAISAGVGLFIGTFALIAAAGRRDGTYAHEFLARALPDSGGHNVVNVILVDFRGLDTFGEITVLLVAAIGIVALVRAPRDDDEGEEES